MGTKWRKGKMKLVKLTIIYDDGKDGKTYKNIWVNSNKIVYLVAPKEKGRSLVVTNISGYETMEVVGDPEDTAKKVNER
jgi:hypothetical protein